MIVVTVELWPGGLAANRRRLGVMTIVNDDQGTATVGSYTALLFKAGKTLRLWKNFEIKGFRRKRFGVWYLMAGILAQIPTTEAFVPTQKSEEDEHD